MKKNILALILLIGCFEGDKKTLSGSDSSKQITSARSHSNCRSGEDCYYSYNLEDYDYGQDHHICAYEFYGTWGEEIQIDPYESNDFNIQEQDGYLEIEITNDNDFTYMLDIYWKYEGLDC